MFKKKPKTQDPKNDLLDISDDPEKSTLEVEFPPTKLVNKRTLNDLEAQKQYEEYLEPEKCNNKKMKVPNSISDYFITNSQ